MRCYQRDGRKEPWSLQDADILAAAPGLGIQIQPDYYHASFLPRSTLSQRPADAQFPNFLGSGDPMIDGIFPAVWVPPSPGHCTGVPLNPSGRPRNQTDRCTKDFPWRLPFPEIFDWETVKSTRKIVYLKRLRQTEFHHQSHGAVYHGRNRGSANWDGLRRVGSKINPRSPSQKNGSLGPCSNVPRDAELEIANH
jgi:hypothetical protein